MNINQLEKYEHERLVKLHMCNSKIQNPKKLQKSKKLTRKHLQIVTRYIVPTIMQLGNLVPFIISG